MVARERGQIEYEIRELETLIERFRQARDPETCWAVYVLTQCLAHRRRWLAQSIDGRRDAPASEASPPEPPMH